MDFNISLSSSITNIWPKHHSARRSFTLMHAWCWRINFYMFFRRKKAFETKIGRVLNAAKMAICTCPVVVDVKLYFYVKQMDALRNFCRCWSSSGRCCGKFTFLLRPLIYLRAARQNPSRNGPNQSAAVCVPCVPMSCSHVKERTQRIVF